MMIDRTKEQPTCTYCEKKIYFSWEAGFDVIPGPVYTNNSNQQYKIKETSKEALDANSP